MPDRKTARHDAWAQARWSHPDKKRLGKFTKPGKTRRQRPVRRRKMGEASAAIKGSGSLSSPVKRRSHSTGSILDDMTGIIDRLDHVKEIKDDDLRAEGKSALAENHFKVGCVTAAKALMMRARALLEDYGGDLTEDDFSTPDDVSGDDLKRKHTIVDDDDDLD